MDEHVLPNPTAWRRWIPRIAVRLCLTAALGSTVWAQGPLDDPLAVEPEVLAAHLIEHRDDIPRILPQLADALAAETAEERAAHGEFVIRTAQALTRGIVHRGPPWTDDAIDLLLTVQLVDPRRVVVDPDFRRQTLARLPHAIDPAAPMDLRHRLLAELERIRHVELDAAEAIAVAWGVAQRPSAEWHVTASDAEFRIPGDGSIDASIFSLTSWYFDPADAEHFLAALERTVPPGRDLLVLVDPPMHRALARPHRRPNTHLLPTHGQPHTPWPRDPLLLARRPDGGVVLLQRPNLQAGREADSNLGREILQQLPGPLFEAWGKPRWTTAPTPFHNGQILLSRTPAGDAAWVSLHSLEEPILHDLGLDRVPVDSFARPDGVQRYVDAARRAADALGRLVGRPVRFVHALPKTGQGMAPLGGGAGFDLDSLLTLLPATAGRPGTDAPPGTALVADVDLGITLFGEHPDSLRRLIDSYGLRDVPNLGSTLADYAQSPRPRRLDTFLEAVAEHLEAQGWRVERLPLLPVPTALVQGRTDLNHPDFLITWNNVVLETGDGRHRAEGFASGLPALDAAVSRIFADAGYSLHYLPPLVESIRQNGGYRCASNHLRGR